MSYHSLTVGSSCGIKRFSHRRRFERALALLDVRASDRVLDYGAGDGYFVRLANESYPESELVAYDPDPIMFTEFRLTLDGTENVAVARDTHRFPQGYFSKIVCVEVFEHLEPEPRTAVLAEMLRLLAPGGSVVISVPIEIGLSSLLKNLVRVAIRHHHPGTTISNIVRSLLGLPIDRTGISCTSHIGLIIDRSRHF
jgi:SAM-dependent methyltransferase